MAQSDRARAEPQVSGFEQFFRANYPAVARVAQSVVGDSHLAQDVAQDAFIAAERRWQDGGPSAATAAWVKVAAVHLGLNALRGERRRDARQLRSTPVMAPAGPEELALDAVSRQEVRAALARLPKKAATVLVLRHSGSSYAEVASALQVRVSHVGTMLRRAEAALRKEIERETRS